MIKHILILIVVLSYSSPVFGAETLCSTDEQVIFSCGIKGSSKTLSICASRPLTKNKGYLQYRFGAPGKTELEFPASREGSLARFSYSHYFRAQVDNTEVSFKNEGYEYSVFSDYEGDVKPIINETGVRITDTATAKERTLLCRGRVVNHLASLAGVVPCEKEDSSGECR